MIKMEKVFHTLNTHMEKSVAGGRHTLAALGY